MASPVRRSSRARRPATTIYDEAIERERERRESMEAKKTKLDDEDDDESDGESMDEDHSVDNDEESETSDSDEDASVSKAPPPKKKKVTPTKGSPAVVKRGKKPSTVSSSTQKTSRPKSTGATVATKTAFTKARITQALKMLSKSVLNNHHRGTENSDSENDDEMDQQVQDETPKTSLVAALLASAKPVPGIPSTTRPKSYFYQQYQHTATTPREKRKDAILGVCLPQLDGILHHLVRTTEHQGPHELHVQLLNLLFRSVGGSTRTNIASDTDLDDLEDEDWDDLISKVVTVMKNESDADQTLLVADDEADDDDDENVRGLTTRQIGAVVYRTLYKEFWYRLGHVLLAHSPSPAVAMVSEEEEDDDSDSELDSDDNDDSDSDGNDTPKSSKKKKSKPKKKKKASNAAQQAPKGFSSNRFQLEKVRDLILRMTELVSVGQPDLRAAGTLAVLQLAKACIERTVELEQKIRVATRQLRAASRAGSKRKKELLQHHLDNWKRHKAELEEIVEGPVFQGVFIHRYRDTNDRIRRDCLRALSEISLIRPDLFLMDTYLKYFGWMASDKVACVRVAALEGLLAPFRDAGGAVEAPTATSAPFSIDVSTMHNVTLKFLPRIVDCTDDAQSTKVQELAVRLLLSMLREEFLDDWEDDVGWDKVNMKALDSLSSPKVRKDALYFVMEQLDAFDTDGKGAASLSEKKQSEQVVAIARWAANKLCDGSIPIDNMNIELVDCLVQSILDMPEHKELVQSWSMILKAIRSENPQQGSANEREEVATQRVLLRILATSAKMELDKGASQTETSKPAVTKKRRRSANSETRLEDLSTALLKNLPHLLAVFKSDAMSLRDVTKLPSAITLSVLGLPSRKTDFQNLVKTLCQLYLDSTDEPTLQNIALTLSNWVEGDHTRVSEVKITLKRLSGALQDRLMELFRDTDPHEGLSQKTKSSKKSKRSGRSRRSSSQTTDGDSTVGATSMFSASPEADAEHSVSLLMLRWNILLMRCQPQYLFEEADGEGDDEDEIEGLFFTISEAMGKRLSDRMPMRDEKTDAVVATSEVWKDLDPEVHEEVATTIQRALKVMLIIVSWQLSDTLLDRKEFESTETPMEDDMEIDEYNYPVIKMRNNLVKLLGLCFDQHLPNVEGLEYTQEQHEFAETVQATAGQVASDLRTLFPFDWSKASDPIRQALALTNGNDFAVLLSGFARYFQSREDSAQDHDDSSSLVQEALLPLARVTTMNFDGFFRKEASMIMQHISGSGNLASQTILSLSRTLKKTNPIRMLESHMGCLRMAFENWLDTEPVIPEDTSPTDEEIQKFEDAEKQHADALIGMEQVASKLSSTLGVAGRLANDSLKKAIFGFMREGIRYSFDGSENNQQDDDELVVGSRLAFLLVLSKYSIWIKKEKGHLEQLSDFVIQKESELRRHPEFEEILEADLNALVDFKKTLGIKQLVTDTSFGTAADEDVSISVAATPSPSTTASSRRGATSTLSKGSRASHRSGMSAQSELSPLYEEEDDAEKNSADSDDEDDKDEGDASPTPQKRRRLDSYSRRGTERTIQEENEKDESGSEGSED